MAAVLFEEQFCCCICLDIYTDPVSIPCGHNFCQDCIEGYWDTRDKPVCPLCKETFTSRPDLRINRDFADIIDYLKRSLSATRKLNGGGEVTGSWKNSQKQLSTTGDVPCDVCNGIKVTVGKSCLKCQTSYGETLCKKHKKPLEMFCKKDQTPVCVECIEKDHGHHQVVPMQKESKRMKVQLRQTKSDIQQLIQDKLRKVEQIKQAVDQGKKITEKEIQRSAQICSMLITAIETHQAGLVEELKQRQEEAERRSEELVNELEQEISDLQMRGSELQLLELTHNPVHLLQSFPSLSRLPPSRDWSKVAFHSDNCMGAVRGAMYKLVDVCQELANTLSAADADKMNQYAVDVTLDPATASGWLILAADGKKVSLSSQKKKAALPDIPQRFDSCVCVLGKQSFVSGRSYWEVQVGDKTDWDLGVARQSINRKGAIMVRPDSGYWAICRRKGGTLRVCTSPSVTLHLQGTPQKVGVFLDYDEGVVSFYNAEAKTHIYTYSGCTFTEPLHPYFNPCVQDNGRNVAPLMICPVEGISV